MDEWTDGRMFGRTDGRTDAWMDGCTDGWMDRWTDAHAQMNVQHDGSQVRAPRFQLTRHSMHGVPGMGSDGCVRVSLPRACWSLPHDTCWSLPHDTCSMHAGACLMIHETLPYVATACLSHLVEFVVVPFIPWLTPGCALGAAGPAGSAHLCVLSGDNPRQGATSRHTSCHTSRHTSRHKVPPVVTPVVTRCHQSSPRCSYLARPAQGS